MILILTSKKTCYGPRLPKGYTSSLPALLVTCETELGRGLATVGLQRTALTEGPQLTQKEAGALVGHVSRAFEGCSPNKEWVFLM